MKILRVRRGFTTNSSSYTEWLPPPNGSTPAAAPPGPNGPAQAQTGPVPVTPPTPAVTVAPPAQQAVPATNANLAGNTSMVLGLLAALAAVFLGERLVRRLRRSRQQEEGGDDE